MSRMIEIGTQENTKVLANDEKAFGANHEYLITSVGEDVNEVLTKINFQKGPRKENPLNGIFHEDLIVILIDRLNSLNEGEFRCRENSVAITKLEEAMMWLRKRTEDRRQRGVLGTSNK